MADYDLLVKITGDASSLISAIGAAGKNVSDFTKGIEKIGKTLTIVGGAITAAFGLIIKQTVDTGDAFNDMSLRTGVAVEDLSALAYAAKQSGTDIESMETSLKFLTRAIDDTSKGIGTAKDTFAKLGISVTDTEGKLRPTVEVMKDVATAIAAIENPTEQAATAMELFGARSGTQLVPLLKLGEAGIDSLMKKAEELGIVLSTSEAKAADNFKDKMNDLKESLGAVGRDIANILIPPLLELVNKAVEIIKKIREWADAHKPLVEMIVKVGATLGALAAVGGPILLATSAFIKMQGAITALGTISSGPIGIAILAIGAIALGSKLLYDRLEKTVGGMRDFREGLKLMSLAQINIEIQSLADSAEQLQKRFSEIPKGIGQQEILTMMDEINKRLEMLYGRREEITKVADAIGGFGEEIGKTTNKIETFDEMVARMAEETKKANEAVAKSTEDLANIMQPTYDRLYEMSHTAEEIAVRSLNAQKAASEEAVKALNLSADTQAEALAKIAELYNIEVGLIIEKLEEEKQKQIEVAKTTEVGADAIAVAIRKIKGEYDPLIAKVKELATETETSAARQVRAYERIYDAAGKLTTIKLPGGGVISTETIIAPNVGPGYYAGPTPTLQTGTSLVTKTGLAIIDKGEAVLTPEQNKAYQSGGNHFTVNINNPIVRNDDDITKIRNEINKALDESKRQFLRRGSELALGM